MANGHKGQVAGKGKCTEKSSCKSSICLRVPGGQAEVQFPDDFCVLASSTVKKRQCKPTVLFLSTGCCSKLGWDNVGAISNLVECTICGKTLRPQHEQMTKLAGHSFSPEEDLMANQSRRGPKGNAESLHTKCRHKWQLKKI